MKDLRLQLIESRIKHLQENTDFVINLLRRITGYAVIVGDFDGNIMVFNEGAHRIFGFDAQEVVGCKCIEEFYPSDFVKSGNLDVLFDRLLRDGGCQYELEREKKSGEVFPGQSLLTLIQDNEGRLVGFIEITEDITERKHREDDILKSESRYRTILEEMHDAYIEVDLEGNLSLVNSAACRVLGYTKEELQGLRLRNVIVQKDRKKVDEAFDEVYRTHKPNEGINFAAVKKNNETIYAEMSVTPLMNERQWNTGFRCVCRDITDRMELQNNLAYMSTHDWLTSLPNRALLNDRFEVESARAQRNGKKLTVVMLDLDKFKNVNDTLGHNIGDLLLKSVATRLTEIVRKHDTVVRLGGDEFVIVRSDIHTDADVGIFAQRILDVFQEPHILEDQTVTVTASIGVVVYPDDGEELDSLLKKADKLMYSAKQGGRNTFKCALQSV
jgi:diguanylate cyclase (GGDEF)-like protein/PAS domain S-box-containing protein